MSFETVLQQSFPGAIEEAEFNARAAEELGRLGFTRNNSIAAIAACRDEISQTWAEDLASRFGQAFSLNGLAGMIFAGVTGFRAAQGHSPIEGGRERYIFFAGPHVGIGADGEPGAVLREGREKPSTACGALVALLAELKAGRLGPTDDPNDPELSLIRRRVGERAAGDSELDLFSLTLLTHEVIREELERILEATVDPATADCAVMTGVQIHGPGSKNYIQPRSAHALVGGKRLDLDLVAPGVR